MKTSVKLGAFVTALAMIAGASMARAADSTSAASSPSARGAKKASAPTLIFNRKLISTTLSTGSTLTTISGGQVAVDSPLTFTCPSGGCTVTASLEVQVGDSTADGNQFGVCAELDDIDMPPTGGCPFLGTLPTNGTWMGAAFTFSQSGVTAGRHKIQGFVYTFFGGAFANYSITYRLYTP